MRILLVPFLFVVIQQADATACEWKVTVKGIASLSNKMDVYRPATVGEGYCRNYWCKHENIMHLDMPNLGKDNACYATPVLNHYDGMQVNGTFVTVRCEIEKLAFSVAAKSLHGQPDEVSVEVTGRDGAYQITIICEESIEQ